MTPSDVERLAMALPGTVMDPHEERIGFHHQRLFALVHDASTLYLRLSVDDQATLLARAPEIFAKFMGRGPTGLTVVALDRIDAETLEAAIRMAWRNGPTPQH